jgi:hypothetical protein
MRIKSLKNVLKVLEEASCGLAKCYLSDLFNSVSNHILKREKNKINTVFAPGLPIRAILIF